MRPEQRIGTRALIDVFDEERYRQRKVKLGVIKLGNNGEKITYKKQRSVRPQARRKKSKANEGDETHCTVECKFKEKGHIPANLLRTPNTSPEMPTLDKVPRSHNTRLDAASQLTPVQSLLGKA